MDVGIPVEMRRWSRLVPHGIAAGLAGGVALGLVQFVIAAGREQGAITPFRLVASLVLGDDALDPATSAALAIAVGTALHFALAALFGVLFLVGLAFTYQLSARRWLLICYGVLFGFLLWEVNFLAILPSLYSDLTAQRQFSGQIWSGIVAYSVVYGPALAIYVSIVRPGVLADWRR
jgi:hypothetical protein